MMRCQRGQLFAAACKEYIVPDKERSNMLLGECRESRVDIVFGRCSRDNQSNTKTICALLCLSNLSLSTWIVRVHNHAKNSSCGNQLVQQFKSLGSQVSGQPCHSCSITPWPVHAGDETEFHWIASCSKYNWNRAGCFF